MPVGARFRLSVRRPLAPSSRPSAVPTMRYRNSFGRLPFALSYSVCRCICSQMWLSSHSPSRMSTDDPSPQYVFRSVGFSSSALLSIIELRLCVCSPTALPTTTPTLIPTGEPTLRFDYGQGALSRPFSPSFELLCTCSPTTLPTTTPTQMPIDEPTQRFGPLAARVKHLVCLGYFCAFHARWFAARLHHCPKHLPQLQRRIELPGKRPTYFRTYSS
jgi:hypothetical protein